MIIWSIGIIPPSVSSAGYTKIHAQEGEHISQMHRQCKIKWQHTNTTHTRAEDMSAYAPELMATAGYCYDDYDDYDYYISVYIPNCKDITRRTPKTPAIHIILYAICFY